ncbi:hypothetical protein CBL_04291 [Carabus blaptoides fortunei]
MTVCILVRAAHTNEVTFGGASVAILGDVRELTSAIRLDASGSTRSVASGETIGDTSIMIGMSNVELWSAEFRPDHEIFQISFSGRLIEYHDFARFPNGWPRGGMACACAVTNMHVLALGFRFSSFPCVRSTTRFWISNSINTDQSTSSWLPSQRLKPPPPSNLPARQTGCTARLACFLVSYITPIPSLPECGLHPLCHQPIAKHAVELNITAQISLLISLHPDVLSLAQSGYTPMFNATTISYRGTQSTKYEDDINVEIIVETLTLLRYHTWYLTAGC